MSKPIASWSLLVVNAMFVIMAIGVYRTHALLGDGGAWMTVQVGVLGVLCGWVVGMLGSPADQQEARSFGRFASLIAAFLSGYLFTKFTAVVETIAGRLLVDPVYGLRAMVFVSCLIAGVLVMYILRAYLGERAVVTARAPGSDGP